MRPILLRIGDWIFVTRPLILLPAASFYLLGARTARLREWTEALPDAFAWGLVCLLSLSVAAYLVNLVHDEDADRLNDKGHYLTRGIFTRRTVVAMALGALAVAAVAFRRCVPPQHAPLAGVLALGYAYSLPPIRLVARPGLDVLANAAGYGGLSFVAGWSAISGDTATAWYASVPYMLVVAATFLHTTILDVDGDRAAGKTTFTVRWGVPLSSRLAALACVAAAAMLAWGPHPDARDPLAPAVVLVSMVACALADVRIRRAVRRGRLPVVIRTSETIVQGMTALVVVAAALSFPVFLAIAAGIALLARVYYRARFGITYPGPHAPADAGSATPPPRR